jgi:hypothetical protein
MRWSKYNKIIRQKLPNLKRTIPMLFEGDDKGKYFRCWYCGFINNADRRQVGDGEGVHPEEVIETSSSAIGDAQLMMDSPFMLGVVAVPNQDGSINTGYTNFIPRVTSGCSFCGSRNYR